MMQRFRRAALAGIATLVTSLSISSEASAQFEDRSDELPGISSGSELIVIAAVGVAAIVAVYLLTRGGGEEVENDDAETIASLTSLRLGIASPRAVLGDESRASEGNAVLEARARVPIELIFGTLRSVNGVAADSWLIGISLKH